MHGIVRFVLISIVCGTAALIVKKTGSVYKRLCYYYILIWFMVLYNTLSVVPLEDYFLTFKSIEKAYSYATFDNSNIGPVVSGKSSDWVLGEKNNVTTYVVIPKTSDGWKVGRTDGEKVVAALGGDDFTSFVYQYMDTSDYFVEISASKQEFTITDSRNSEFEYWNGKYYTYIEDWDDQYIINVNGKEYSFTNLSRVGDNRTIIPSDKTALGILIWCAFRTILNIFIIFKYDRIGKNFECGEYRIAKEKSLKLFKIANLLSIAPWNIYIRAFYNGICWILASIASIEGNENEFLAYLGKVKKEKYYEPKLFILALFYRAKGEMETANKWYEKYLASKQWDSKYKIILKKLFEGTGTEEEFAESIKQFRNPAIIQLFRDNGIRMHNFSADSLE